MTRIRPLLTPSSCLQLANDFISGTQVEKYVINFREKYCFTNDKEGKELLGHGHWNQFKQRNAYHIVGKRGRKYKMDDMS